jgi:DNA-binding response OmpR family regulator
MRRAVVGEAPHLLLVGCGADLGEVLRRYFCSEGYQVSEAADAGEAGSVLAGGGIATAILDCVEGEAGAWLRLADSVAEQGVAPILVTGDPRTLRALRDSRWPALAKPFRLSVLHAMVEEAVGAGAPPPSRSPLRG